MQNDTQYKAPVHTAFIESLDQEGRGVGRVEGKAVFIEGALVGEKVTYQPTTRKPTYEFGRVLQVLQSSSQRVIPQCPHFARCGGCSLQHLDTGAQVASKQRLLEDNLWHISRIKPERMLAPLLGPAWGYRHKARLRVKYVPAKQRVLVGFNEKHTHFVVDMNSCEVLPKRLSALIIPLQEMIYRLTIRDAIPQIEVAIGEGNVIVLVFRMLEPPEPADEEILRAFAHEYSVQVWEQRKGLNTVKPLEANKDEDLGYTLPEFDLHFPFSPVEFTQVNPHINRVMIRRAMQLLEPTAGEKIADFFCGLGNFSLPIARSGASVLGLEGSEALVARAQQNAKLNGLEADATFKVLDLFLISAQDLETLGQFDKWLIDPPRDGAMELIKSLANAGEADRVNVNPKRIVYVSCNPATLARDAGLLVLQKGYRLAACGVINMFPHTTHVESIALFEQQ